jgi:hypothetical protein
MIDDELTKLMQSVIDAKAQRYTGDTPSPHATKGTGTADEAQRTGDTKNTEDAAPTDDAAFGDDVKQQLIQDILNHTGDQR